MELNEDILQNLKCCLGKFEFEHIVKDPIMLKCGGNACRECLNGSICRICNKVHQFGDANQYSTNKSAEILIKACFNSLLDKLKLDLSENLILNTSILFNFKIQQQ
jgi:hypothetical protein